MHRDFTQLALILYTPQLWTYRESKVADEVLIYALAHVIATNLSKMNRDGYCYLVFRDFKYHLVIC